MSNLAIKYRLRKCNPLDTMGMSKYIDCIYKIGEYNTMIFFKLGMAKEGYKSSVKEFMQGYLKENEDE
jgi:hypothetical protein